MTVEKTFRLSLVMSLMVSFCVVLFLPRDVLDKIWNLIESVSKGFPTYFFMITFHESMWSDRVLNPASPDLQLDALLTALRGLASNLKNHPITPQPRCENVTALKCSKFIGQTTLVHFQRRMAERVGKKSLRN